MATIPFVDVVAQQSRMRDLIDTRVSNVLDHGSFILGPEVFELEEALAERAMRRNCIACASGTDALQMSLMALGVGLGDRVIVPDFSFVATAEAVRLVGAEPVFADVDPITYNLDPDSTELAFDLPGKTPVGVIAVDLFGHPANGDELEELVRSLGAWLVVDGAQSFGAMSDGRSGLARGVIATTSFYPSKPLGAYGDGGAIFCDDDNLAMELRSIQNHGMAVVGSGHDRLGLTGRLDTLQAAVLLAKLELFDAEVANRRLVAQRYSAALSDRVVVPRQLDGVQPVWAQYTVEVDDREKVRPCLDEAGVPTRVFYPRPLHMNAPYSDCPVVPTGTPVASQASSRVMSLPMHPYLDEEVQDRIVSTLRSVLARQ